MLNFIILALIGGWVFLAIRSMRKNKGLSCGCSAQGGCSGCSSCAAPTSEDCRCQAEGSCHHKR